METGTTLRPPVLPATGLILLGLTVALASSTGADDAVHSGPVGSFSHGSFEIGFTQEGELQDCDVPPPGLAPRVIARMTYVRLDGVCDDQSETPCSGRFSKVLERCSADDIGYTLREDDPVTPVNEFSAAFYNKGRFRICFDETASGYCDEGNEIARGPETWHETRTFIINVEDGVPETFDETGALRTLQQVTHSKSFSFGGRNVRVRPGRQAGDGFFRVDDACLFVDNRCPLVLNHFDLR